jgi:DNA-binding response OmpR family regulator
MHITITIIEDERLLSAQIQRRLEAEGYLVSIFSGYSQFMSNGNNLSDLYIIDISLGDGSGLDIITWLRNTVASDAPILIISWYGEQEKIIQGLNTGADDYMVKPVLPDEMLARIRALFRRPPHLSTPLPILYKEISFDTVRKEVTVSGVRVYLTHIETMIVELFLRNPGKVIDRTELIRSIWWGHRVWDVWDNNINVTLSKVRRKLGNSFELKTIYNEGYIFE